MASTLNISAYRFVTLSNTAQWRECIHSQADKESLKGTVLLAEEGINVFVAGPEGAVRRFMRWLTDHDVFAGLAVKESWSTSPPFARLSVKIKPELIRMNRPSIRPQTQRAPVVDAKTLSRWLDAGHDDAGREIALLDTRNAFEVDHGCFSGALDWRLQKFSDFPQALEEHRAALLDKTVVTYCTGGIRCEKAALWMAKAGVEHVWQLDGGILNYFDVASGKHFEGHCFVFDERRLLADTLAPMPPV